MTECNNWTLLNAAILVVWTAYFTIPIFWLLVHPFARFWQRRRGRTYAAFALTLWLSTEVIFVWQRAIWFDSRFTRHWYLLLAGAMLTVVEPLVLFPAEGELGMPILVGWAERDPQQFPPRVIDTGVYARVRHPRYAAAMCALLGLALLSGSWRMFLASLASLPLYWLLTVAEERELTVRIGDAYTRYQRRVPRFLPRLQI